MEVKSPKMFVIAALLLGTLYGGSADMFADFSTFADSSCGNVAFASRVAAGLGETIYGNAVANTRFVFFQPCGVHQVKVEDAETLLNNPHFDVKRKTIVFISGWRTRKTDDSLNLMADAYFCRGGYNYLYVNTGGYLHMEYVTSALSTTELGEAVAIGLQKLGIHGENIHLVGHSLGSHISGSAGRHYYKLTGQQIGRITGLDPARPCFKEPAVFPSLGRGDATFVDIIHSNPHKLGTEEAIGDADFYAADLDIIQPGCSGNICSHGRAVDYYMETVYSGNESNFMAKQCETFSDLERKSCTGAASRVGLAVDKNTKGIYSFAVNKQSPYGLYANSYKGYKCANCREGRWNIRDYMSFE